MTEKKPSGADRFCVSTETILLIERPALNAKTKGNGGGQVALVEQDLTHAHPIRPCRRRYPFTAPATTPEVIWRCITRKKSTMGNTDNTSIGKKVVQLVEKGPTFL